MPELWLPIAGLMCSNVFFILARRFYAELLCRWQRSYAPGSFSRSVFTFHLLWALRHSNRYQYPPPQICSCLALSGRFGFWNLWSNLPHICPNVKGKKNYTAVIFTAAFLPLWCPGNRLRVQLFHLSFMVTVFIFCTYQNKITKEREISQCCLTHATTFNLFVFPLHCPDIQTAVNLSKIQILGYSKLSSMLTSDIFQPS